MDVGRADQLVLVGAECHPLGEHIVGVGEPLPRLGIGTVAEADAVLAERLPGRRIECDERALRVDQPAVLAHLDGEHPEALVGLESVLAGGRAQQLAGSLLGAALPRRVADVAAPHQPPAAWGKKITRSASAGTSEKSRTMVASRLPAGPSWGIAAHMPRSSWRRNSRTRRSSSSATAGSPSASRTSPFPGVMRSSFIPRLCPAASLGCPVRE